MRNCAVGLAMVLAIVVLMPSTATAQGPATSLEEISGSGRLVPGDRIYVTDIGGRRMKGDVIELTSAAISLTDGRVTWRLAETEVGRVERADSLKSGMWIGAGLALAGAIGWCHLVEKRHSEYCFWSAYGLPISLGVGVGLGAFLDANRREVLYEAAKGADVRLFPVLTQTEGGVRLSIRW